MVVKAKVNAEGGYELTGGVRGGKNTLAGVFNLSASLGHSRRRSIVLGLTFKYTNTNEN